MTERRPAHLATLEAESIQIFREVAAQAARPVLLYSIGKDSSVLLHLARKAFYPAKPPFPLLHIDTTWKFRAMIAFRDETVRRFGLDLRTHTNPEGLRDGINPFDHGGAYTQIMKTDALKQALTAGNYDFAIGGARRDEERSRAKERIFSVRAPGHAWDPKRQRPELWHLYNGQLAPGETMRVFPLSNWTELDVWTYIAAEEIDVVPLYFAAMRPTVMRGGQIIVVDDDRMRFEPGETAGGPHGAVPLAGLLSAVRGGGVGGRRHGCAAGGDAGHTGFRTRRAADRPGAGLLDGAQEARGVFLMPDSVLRVLTCGSVDDGKSTLIGRLLFECGTIPDDVMAALERDFEAVRHGRRRHRLRAAGRWAGSRTRTGRDDRRRLPVLRDAGAPLHPGGHARPPAVHPQHGHRRLDRRPGHAADRRAQGHPAANPPPCRHRVAAGHPAGGAGGQQDGPGRVSTRRCSPRSGTNSERCWGSWSSTGLFRFRSVPATATTSPAASARMPWYTGPSLLQALETADPGSAQAGPFRMPVQYVNRPDHGFRGYAGTIATGRVRPGDKLVNAGAHTEAAVARIVTMDGDLAEAGAGDPVTLVLDREIDISRGDVLSADPAPAAGGRAGKLDRLDGRDAAVPRPRLSADAGHQDGGGDGDRYHHAAGYGDAGRNQRAGTGAERNRPRVDLADASGGVRAVRDQPRTGRVHPDRPADPRHGGRRHGDRRSAPATPTSSGTGWMSTRRRGRC